MDRNKFNIDMTTSSVLKEKKEYKDIQDKVRTNEKRIALCFTPEQMNLVKKWAKRNFASSTASFCRQVILQVASRDLGEEKTE